MADTKKNCVQKYKVMKAQPAASHQNIKWSDMPARFLDWAASEAESEFAAAISIINQSLPPMGRGATTDSRSADPDLARLLTQIQNWMPARRRNSEGEYKIELRKHLESLKYRLNEEHDDSLSRLTEISGIPAYNPMMLFPGFCLAPRWRYIAVNTQSRKMA